MSEHKNTLYIYSNSNAACGNCGQHLTPEAKSCPGCGTVFEGREYLNVTKVSEKDIQQNQQRRSRIYYSARSGHQTWKINPLILIIIILAVSFAILILVNRFSGSVAGVV